MSLDPSVAEPQRAGEGQAPRRIVLIVVVTLASLCGLYMGTLAICILAGLKPDEKVLLQFVAGGTYVLGVLSGILVNPHSGSPARADADSGKSSGETNQTTDGTKLSRPS
jgi:hypothetical protein